MKQLSPIDAAFVLLERPRTPFHVTMVNLYDRSTCVGKPTEFDDIVEAVRKSLPAAPTLRRRIVRVPFDLDYPYWVEDKDFDLDFHMRHLALPKPGNWAQFRKQVSRLVSRPLDLSRPPWEMTVIDGVDAVEGIPAGAFATVLKIHHSAVDGEAGVELLTALHQQDPAQEPAELLDRWKPERVPRNGELLRRAGLNSVLRPANILQLLLSNARTLVRAAFEEIRSPDDGEDVEIPRVSFNGRVSAHRVFDDAYCTLDELKRVRKAVPGATINDVCLTIVAEALRRYLDAKGELPTQSLVTAVPISTRTPEQARSGGNQIAVAMISLHTNIAAPLERLARISSETRERKAVQDGVVMPVILEAVQNLPGALVGVAARAVPLVMSSIASSATSVPCNTMVSNVPGPIEPLYLLGSQIVRSTGCAPLMDGGGLLHSVCSFAGRFAFSFTACPDLMPDTGFYRDCLQGAMRDMVRAAGDAPVSTGSVQG